MNLQHLQTGSLLSLGRYPQGAGGEIRPIQWQVLEVNDGRALLLSRYVLDCMPYHSECAHVRWHDSRLRQWLREVFLPTAFSGDELSRICQPEPADDPADEMLWQLFGMEDATESIRDSVFLLSQADILRHFPSGDSLFCPGARAAMTPWAQANHPDVDQPGSNISWWLRSSFNQNTFALVVSPADSIGVSLIDPANLQGVRPAIWVHTET